MTTQTFVFFHVGENVEQPEMLAESIFQTNPDAEVFFCKDKETPNLRCNVNNFECSGDRNSIMLFRMKAFSELGLNKPAIYLDTDMLVLKTLNPRSILKDNEVVFCKRAYNLGGAFIGQQRGINLMEYDKQPLGNVYPVVACATVTKSYRVWQNLVDRLNVLDPKFLKWYGDQEAMKSYIFDEKTKKNTAFFSEEEFGCLIDEKMSIQNVSILHFKGAQRKPLMKKIHELLLKGILNEVSFGN